MRWQKYILAVLAAAGVMACVCLSRYEWARDLPCATFLLPFLLLPFANVIEKRWRRKWGIDEPKPDSIAAIIVAIAILVFILGFVVMAVLTKYGVLAGF
jgi:hypothetical protein